MEYLQGIAWADYCRFTYNGKLYDVAYDDDACQPYPFGYFRNETTGNFDFKIGGLSMTHEDLRNRPKYGNTQSHPYICYSEEEEKFTGRVYLREKLLTFWEKGLPDKASLRKIISDIENGFQDELWMDVSLNDFIIAVESDKPDYGVIATSVSEYLYGKTSPNDNAIIAQKKQQSELDSYKRLGQQKLSDWETNDPHADRMYRNVVEEAVEMDGYASPDSVRCSNDEMGWNFRGYYDESYGCPVPFGYLNGEMIVGQIGWKHNTMIYVATHPDVEFEEEYDLEYEVDSNGISRTCDSYCEGWSQLECPGRVWLESGFLTFWGWDSEKMTRQFFARLIDDLDNELQWYYDDFDFNLYDFVLLYPDKDNYNNLLGCKVRDFISGSNSNIDMDKVAQKNRQKSDFVLNKERGKQNLTAWQDNSPYADPMYKNVMEKKKNMKKNLTEREITNTIIKVIKESFNNKDISMAIEEHGGLRKDYAKYDARRRAMYDLQQADYAGYLPEDVVELLEDVDLMFHIQDKLLYTRDGGAIVVKKGNETLSKSSYNADFGATAWDDKMRQRNKNYVNDYGDEDFYKRRNIYMKPDSLTTSYRRGKKPLK